MDTVLGKMTAVSAAEEFLDYFGVDYDRAVVNVNRLHILKRFHQYIGPLARLRGSTRTACGAYRRSAGPRLRGLRALERGRREGVQGVPGCGRGPARERGTPARVAAARHVKDTACTSSSASNRFRTSAQIRVHPVTNTIMRQGVPAIINPYDLFALEEALRLKDKLGGTVTVLTMGPPQAEDALRKASPSAPTTRFW